MVDEKHQANDGDNVLWSENQKLSKPEKSSFFTYLRDTGFSYWVLDMFRCKRLLGNVEVTFMEEAMEAEEDVERLLRRTEKRAFQAF
ncbi:hypothetical protein KY290_001195 [Solanum tuberosum]|uniref:Uncharacterized protein n=1 Tax=Solanum tuberosum TaxID=4113 RepID=A0ABQ7WLG8_SOLTU|nr:hypothetical protein KY290_001195 [Solanum tuberosum]